MDEGNFNQTQKTSGAESVLPYESNLPKPKKRGKAIIAVIVVIIAAVAVFAVIAANRNAVVGTYYLRTKIYSGDYYYYDTVYFELRKDGTVKDDSNITGKYKVKSDNIQLTFSVFGTSVVYEGTIKDGVMTLNTNGSQMQSYAKLENPPKDGKIN